MVKKMQSPIYDIAAQWVCERANSIMSDDSKKSEIADSIAALHALSSKCAAAIVIPDLFPGTTLEFIYIPAAGAGTARRSMAAAMGAQDDGLKVTTRALSTIGRALLAEFAKEGTDMIRYEGDEGDQAIAYLPSVRDTVLQATGVTLLA